MPRGDPRVRAGDGSKNVVGGQVRERREALDWSQAQLTRAGADPEALEAAS